MITTTRRKRRDPLATATKEQLVAAISVRLAGELTEDLSQKTPGLLKSSSSASAPSSAAPYNKDATEKPGEEAAPSAQSPARPVGPPAPGPAAAPVSAPAGNHEWRVTTLAEAGYHTISPEDLPADWPKHYVPLIGRLAAGEGVETIEAEESPPGWACEYVACDGAPKHAVALRVIGASMQPTYWEGDVVIADPAQPVARGLACVIYQLDGDRRAALKVMRSVGRAIHLESYNRDHKPIKLKPSQVVAAYSVVTHLPRIVRREVR